MNEEPSVDTSTPTVTPPAVPGTAVPLNEPWSMDVSVKPTGRVSVSVAPSSGSWPLLESDRWYAIVSGLERAASF